MQSIFHPALVTHRLPTEAQVKSVLLTKAAFKSLENNLGSHPYASDALYSEAGRR